VHVGPSVGEPHPRVVAAAIVVVADMARLVKVLDAVDEEPEGEPARLTTVYCRLPGCCRQGAIVEQTRAAQELTKVRTVRKCVWNSGVVNCGCAGSRLPR